MREQRRAAARYDVRVIGGPLNGMWLLLEEMSDGTAKILGGVIYPMLAEYELFMGARELRWRAA